MKTINFAGGGAMPAFGLGTWKSGPDEVYRAVGEALKLGYRHIDCARIYGNEAEVGRALREAFDADVVSRADLWITSKLWNDRHEPAEVAPALDETLADLGLEYLDLYLVHWPVALRKGAGLPLEAGDMISLDDLPIAETWAAMEALPPERCRHIGVSNFSAAKLEALCDAATRPPECNQVELHPYLQQTELLERCAARGVAVTAYSPLGSRDRPKSLVVENEPVLLDDPIIGDIAARHGATPAQVLIAWALARGTAVIPKSVNPKRLAENLAATELSLSAADLSAIAGLDRHRRYVSGGFWAVDGSDYTLARLWDESA
jgi:alcohol dehydrogenase (NADP+)